MRFARLLSVAALVVSAGGAIGVVACGRASGSGGDAGLTSDECAPDDPGGYSCDLPCQYDVQQICDHGVWTCPPQPTEPTLQQDSFCLGQGGDASPPECWYGRASCGCTNEWQYVWYCTGGSGFVDAGPSESGADVFLDAPGEAPPDVVPDASADASTDVAVDAPDE